LENLQLIKSLATWRVILKILKLAAVLDQTYSISFVKILLVSPDEVLVRVRVDRLRFNKSLPLVWFGK
jgi:hypothetical protein